MASDLVLNGGFETASDWTYSGAARDNNVAQTVATPARARVIRQRDVSDYITVSAGDNCVLRLSYRYLTKMARSAYWNWFVYTGNVDNRHLNTVSIRWYDSGSSLLSTTTWTHLTDFPIATEGWQAFCKFATAPASTVKCKIYIRVDLISYTNPNTGIGIVDEDAGVINDLSFYVVNNTGGRKPANPVALGARSEHV